MSAKIDVIREVSFSEEDSDWRLCFQWCFYHYTDGEFDDQFGYRFIWRRPDNSLQAARGQARIPSVAIMEELIQLARNDGWYGTLEP